MGRRERGRERLTQRKENKGIGRGMGRTDLFMFTVLQLGRIRVGTCRRSELGNGGGSRHRLILFSTLVLVSRVYHVLIHLRKKQRKRV